MRGDNYDNIKNYIGLRGCGRWGIYMKIKEQTIKELDSLSPSELMMVYEVIISLKTESKKQHKVSEGEPAYLRVRKALNQCKGALDEDILLLREDRV